MASTRPVRKASRRTSPFGRVGKESSTSTPTPTPPVVEPTREKGRARESEGGRLEKKTMMTTTTMTTTTTPTTTPTPTPTPLDRWVEPPMRPPAPSFEDYKGLERHGVLSQMLPLGTLPPPAKVKGKGKGELPKRLAPTRRGDSADGVASGPVTPDLTSAAAGDTTKRKRSKSKKAEEQASPRAPTSSVVATYEQILKLHPPAPPAVKSSPTRPPPALRSPAQPSPLATADSRGQTGRSKMKGVVDAAADRAAQVGHHNLGLALKKLYEDSVTDRILAELLDAVLAQRATPRQKVDFQDYIKNARRLCKLENSAKGSARRSSAGGSTSKSPSKVGAQRAAVATSSGSGHAGRKPRLEATHAKSSPWQPSRSARKERASRKSAPAAGVTNGVSKRRSRGTLRRSPPSSVTSSPLTSPSSAPFEEDPMDADGDWTGVADLPPARPPITAARPTAAAAAASLGPKLHTFSTATKSTAVVAAAAPAPTTSKRSSASAGLEQDDAGAGQAVAAKRRRFANTGNFDDVHIRESNLRGSPRPAVAAGLEPSRASASRGKPAPSRTSAVTAATATSATSAYPKRLRNGTVKKLAGHDLDDLASPSPSPLQDPPPPPPTAPAVAEAEARADTPVPPQGRPSKKAKKTARVKMSPIKKKSGVIAGIARSGPGQDSPPGHGPMADRGEDDNEDFCSACGGNGDLLCCDGCDRSFHFTCLDPPMDKDHLPETWFCFVCAAARDPQPRLPRGLFAGLLGHLERKNPVAYNLPADIREYFEGVKTGDEGEYEEAVTQKSRTRAGYDELPDLLKLKDGKGRYVLCFRCGRSSLGRQEIIPCDYCNLHWHLDCVDPPMANPPPRQANGKQRHNWMCPNHVDHELLALDSTARAYARKGSCNGGVRTHKVRRPKNARIMDTALRRGFVNNGLVEIENEPSEAEDEFADMAYYGAVYRLPERGIKLDFIDKIKSLRKEASAPPRPKPRPAARPVANEEAAAEERRARDDFNRRSFADRKAALNLAQFAQANDVGLGGDDIENLLDTLLAEAPPEVVAMLDGLSSGKPSAVPPSPPSSDSRPDQPEQALSDKDKGMLLMLQELIKRRLESGA
ncbi:MAG: hypothetical protein M1832_000229 [Thelocarpon impressellum]|nr:MAG: hypothetical protein M1832_000229 [Thelocarpon impressellum]